MYYQIRKKLQIILTRTLIGPVPWFATLEAVVAVTLAAGFHFLLPLKPLVLRPSHAFALPFIGFDLHVQFHKISNRRLGFASERCKPNYWYKAINDTSYLVHMYISTVNCKCLGLTFP